MEYMKDNLEAPTPRVWLWVPVKGEFYRRCLCEKPVNNGWRLGMVFFCDPCYQMMTSITIGKALG